MEAIERLPELVDADPALVARGRYLSTELLLQLGKTLWYIRIEAGRVAAVTRGPVLMRPVSLSIRIDAAAWEKFCANPPPAGFHDIFALTKSGAASIDGDIELLMAHLRYVKEVLAKLRAPGAPAAAMEPSRFADGEIEEIVGRYIHLDIAGRPHRVYFEEAGEGIPLLCLHTAGADGRQFRHLMTDEAVTRHFRVIAFDLPWHGKSTPPAGWQDEEYRLTTRAYVDAILAVSRGLRLDRPIVMGCSMGGRIVLELAHSYADAFRAVIALEGADHQRPWYDTTWLHRPTIHGGEVSAALISGLVAPQSPDETRWETLWQYMQSGPGIFKGDLYFYRADSDFRDRVPKIDARRCPVFLLTGEYDFSCTQADSERTARQIPGAEFVPMQALGHFPMSENPAQFRRYILPILDRLRAGEAPR
jgi:pimeloyl-ACP methyl ester carboxylesterase